MANSTDKADLGVWAAVLGHDSNINRRGARRTVPMQVLSLGLSRTGTASMQEAYTILGYESPYHFASIFANIHDADMWNEALRMKLNTKNRSKTYGRAEFDQLLGHCAAVTDAPCCVFWEELIDAYPEAKVVLVERDEDKWVRSFAGLADGLLNPVAQYILRFTDPLWYGRIINVCRLWVSVLCGSERLNIVKSTSRDVYRQHYRKIRTAVPEERLLNYKLGTGWKPLCEFLGKPIPDAPFPHKNEADVLQRAFSVAILKALRRSALNIALVLGIMASITWAFVW